ncbi:Fur family transcriptional regulator [Streptomyces paradoxus]|uniref:Fur family transcriptional regulator n=1 Tax=Streptomyces paradoxus TaxID=66375 RepID=UPI0037D53E94
MDEATPGAWRTTPQRTAVLTALRACDGFISAQTLHAALVADGVAVGLTTVYRTLRLLETAGHVDMVRDGDGERLYRPRPTRVTATTWSAVNAGSASPSTPRRSSGG